ncbi:hypothetical protein C0995_015060, partial [Termitomyces sp. Mi166
LNLMASQSPRKLRPVLQWPIINLATLPSSCSLVKLMPPLRPSNWLKMELMSFL